MKHQECNDDNMAEVCRNLLKYSDPHLNIKYAADYLKFINATIEKYYPEKAQKYKYFVDAFQQFADFIYNQRPTLESLEAEEEVMSLKQRAVESERLKFELDLHKSNHMFWSFLMLPEGNMSGDMAPESYLCHKIGERTQSRSCNN